MFLNGIAFGVVQVVLAALVGSKHGSMAAGVVISAGAAGRLLAIQLDRLGVLRGIWPRARLLAVSTLAFISLAAFAPWQLAAVAMSFIGCFSVLFSGLLMNASSEHIHAGSAASMSGQALGMLIGGFAANFGTWTLVAVASLLSLSLFSIPSLIHLTGREPDTKRDRPIRHGLFPFLLAVTSYGPLGLFSTLVALEYGSSWVGPAFILYAIGSWVAARVASRFDLGPAGSAFLAAIGTAVWMFGFSSLPLMLAARFVSGVLVFLAQGATLTRASRDGGSAGVASALAGLGIGAPLASLWCGVLADHSIQLMASTASLATLLLAATVLSLQRRSRSAA
jgi:hypothetical protein